MVAWAFSIAGSAFFPALVLGIFWARATRMGALAGMVVGVSLSLYYILRVEFDSIPWLGVSGFKMEPWFHVQATSAGLFGVVAGFATIIIVSLLTKPEPGSAIFWAGFAWPAGGMHEGQRLYWRKTAPDFRPFQFLAA
jgi:cation/acetate symporter